MTAINLFVFQGNVTRDVELTFLPSGRPFARYTVAQSRVWYDGEGVRQEATDFLQITTYDRQAENDATFLRKGHGVTVQGSMRPWFKPALGKGGVDFVADNVHYHPQPKLVFPKAWDEALPPADHAD